MLDLLCSFLFLIRALSSSKTVGFLEFAFVFSSLDTRCLGCLDKNLPLLEVRV
jgi:hypothetical protein